ncbi:uncharacterized protein AB675_4481 [Cyphellophora attinorum]|uniref:Uncharacterized protein n=1 Tax=Cyphellophora attinorum TaxID=1664694 RepID=A0A0N0NLF4_9EURO|nr:uncharacterized protein AB675_4481 [Phialophora attinorum]KPI39108.1 hypothetical protein AB675_4481 [Phialophora attinorum]
MSQPPSKRRRISAEPTSDHGADQQAKSAPATPRHPSYASPTKASMNRLHPHLAGPRQSLRSLVMDGPAGPRPQDQHPAVITDTTVQEIVSEHNTEADTRPRSAVPQSQTMNDAAATAPASRISATSRIPRQRSPSPFNIIPRQVSSSRSRRRELSLSPDDALPPTPVDLGISRRPAPPQGATSSSPRTSRSGSGRNRLRRRGEQSSVTSSPLKQRSHNIQSLRPILLKSGYDGVNESASDTRPESGQAEEPQPTDDVVAEEESDEKAEVVPEQIREKEAILAALKEQSKQTLARSRQLEEALRVNNVRPTLLADANFIDLLKGVGKATTVHDSTLNLDASTISAEKQLLHLNLFAPANLVLKSTTRTDLVDGKVKLIHDVKFSAPPPWPADTFNAEFLLIVDAESKRVDRIKYIKATHSEGISSELYSWIKRRLADDLVNTDLGGLVWGLGKYFTAAVERARLFRRLEAKYGADADMTPHHDETNEPETDDGLDSTASTPQPVRTSKPAQQFVTAQEAILLSEYLTETHLELPLRPTHQPKEASSAIEPKLLLVNTINLQPNSTATSQHSIALSGVSSGAESTARELFARLVKSRGAEQALEGVWGLLRHGLGVHEAAKGNEHTVVSTGKKRAGRKRKKIA